MTKIIIIGSFGNKIYLTPRVYQCFSVIGGLLLIGDKDAAFAFRLGQKFSRISSSFVRIGSPSEVGNVGFYQGGGIFPRGWYLSCVSTFKAGATTSLRLRAIARDMPPLVTIIIFDFLLRSAIGSGGWCLARTDRLHSGLSNSALL